jgi:hypothetical protein
MSVLVPVVGLLLLTVAALTIFLRADPLSLASGLKRFGVLTLGIIGLIALVFGRVGLAAAAFAIALACFVALQNRQAFVQSRRSMVRTAALEMELDYHTGELEGQVLAGHHEGRMLSAMSFRELQQLYREIATDPESLQLLETYLDGRFPIWRKNADPHGRERLRVSPGPSPMTKEEAYKVLGLETGAAAADIRKAHRRLMQRLHPDVGQTSFLAARINKAKDILLSNHD